MSPSGFGGRAGLRLHEGPGELCPATDRGGATWSARGGELAQVGERIAAGIDHLHVWLHAGEAAAHEFHAGEPGSLAAAVAAIERAREAGVTVAVSSLLTRSSARVLAGLAGWLHAHAVQAWRIVVPEVIGEPRASGGPVRVVGVGALDGLLPRLSVALPLALQAAALAQRLGLRVTLEGAPLCLLGPFAGLGVGRARVFAPVCAGCPARPRCPGVDAGYLRRFAGDELSPRGLRAPVGTPAPAWMFSGPGVLEQVASDMSEGAGARTVRLPVLAGGGGGP